jgi:dipeptidyl aminopeptidase/acylaminoacyl peptidase
MSNTSRRKIVIEDLLKLKFVSDPQMSPDGTRVAFVVKIVNAEKNKYFSHLWMVGTESRTGFQPVQNDDAPVGSSRYPAARQFTHGEVNDGSPRWSPDGKQIAFIRTRDKETQIHLIPADGGEARALTKLPQGVIGNLAWSPNGKQLAFTFSQTPAEWTTDAVEERKKKNLSNPPRVITKLRYRLDGVGFLGGKSHVWIADARNGRARQVTDGDFDHHSLCWSPDGKRIAFFSNRSADPDLTPYAVDLWVTNVGTRRARHILEKIPTPKGYKGNTSWSPDGKFIAYTGHVSANDPWIPRNDRVWIVPASGKGAARNLTASLDRTVGNSIICDTREAFAGGTAPVWSADSQRLFFVVSDNGSAHLCSVGVQGGKVEPLTNGAMDVFGCSADKRVERFALAVAKPTELGELFLFEKNLAVGAQSLAPVVVRPQAGAKTAPLQLSNLTAPFRGSVRVSHPEEVWVKSFDGTKIQGWFLRPPDFDPRKKYPLVFYIHGGPHAMYGNSFFHEFQMLAARGYVVMYTNPRGSMGREEKFAAVIRGDWGNVDYKDLMACADYAARLRYVDNKRMACAGGSYGGYMTNWIIGHTNRFKCAITDRSVVNLVSFAGTSDFPFRDNGYWKGNAWDDTETLVKHSPLTYAAKIKTPLLIIHSEGDLRCPISQAEELYTALKKLGREVVFVRYPQETSHGMSRGGPPDLRIHRLKQITAWLEKHLKPKH